MVMNPASAFSEGLAAKSYELERLSAADGGMYAGHDDTMQV